MAAEAEYWSFPTNPEEFDHDERISYSKLDNKYIAVQDDGTEYEFDEGLKRWIPMLDEALIEEQQRGYMMPDLDAGSDRQGKKRKMDYSNDREVSCAHMHIICSVGHPARRRTLLLPP
jgi:HIV Tat-specific factor 1